MLLTSENDCKNDMFDVYFCLFEDMRDSLGERKYSVTINCD